MRSRIASSLLGAALVITGLTVVVAPQANAALGVRLFLHGTSSTYAEDALRDPTASEGYAPAGVTADSKPPTGTSSKTGLVLEPGGDPGLPVAPTFALGLAGSMTSACVDLFVQGMNPGATFPVFASFGSGPPEVGGSWVYPDPVVGTGSGIVRITTLITLEKPFTLPDDATIFFHINAFDPTPDQRPYTLYYDSVAHPSNVTINPAGKCTPASGSAPAPAPAASASAAPSESAAPSASAAASDSASAEPSTDPSAASAAPSASESAPAGSCGDGASSGGPSASGDPSASSSADPSASGSASASASASPAALQPKAGIPANEPARDATSCRVTTVSLTSSANTVTAGNAPTLTGVARDSRGDAVEGATITIYTKGYGESAYTAAATVKTDSAGQYKIAVRPMKQTSLGANVGGAKSRIISIRVNTRVNIASPAPGASGTRQTFSGNLNPGYARVAVGLAYVTNGRFVVIAQANTDGAGRYAITTTLPRGTFPFVVFTSAHQGTDKGSRSVKLTVR